MRQRGQLLLFWSFFVVAFYYPDINIFAIYGAVQTVHGAVINILMYILKKPFECLPLRYVVCVRGLTDSRDGMLLPRAPGLARAQRDFASRHQGTRPRRPLCAFPLRLLVLHALHPIFLILSKRYPHTFVKT